MNGMVEALLIDYLKRGTIRHTYTHESVSVAKSFKGIDL
jgi:hypothetical protein